jgi:hypothetical protein
MNRNVEATKTNPYMRALAGLAASLLALARLAEPAEAAFPGLTAI